MTINGTKSSSYRWAGITCLGDATIILSGTNTVKGFYDDYPGIQAAAGNTLTINGTGSLTASSNGYGVGIGGGYNIACGNIEIQGGTITATGGNQEAGIGGGRSANCGTITISGGTVTATGGSSGAGIGSGDHGTCGTITISGGTVTATGGNSGAGIGSGLEASCGDITITSGVTKVTATKGGGNSIGAGFNGSCGTVTIGGTVYPSGISQSPYEYSAPPTLTLTSPTVGQVIGSDGKNYAADASLPTGVTKVAMIAYVSGSNGLAIALADEGSLNWETAKSTCEAKTPAFTNGTWKLPSEDEWKQMFSANGGDNTIYTGLNTAITTAGGTTLQEDTIYWSSSVANPGVDARGVHLFDDGINTHWYSVGENSNQRVRACLAF